MKTFLASWFFEFRKGSASVMLRSHFPNQISESMTFQTDLIKMVEKLQYLRSDYSRMLPNIGRGLERVKMITLSQSRSSSRARLDVEKNP